MEADLWYSRVQILAKDIRHRLMQGVACALVGIDIDVAERAEWAQVVHASYVVVVDMSKKHAVDFTERDSERLLTEVGSAVYQDASGVGLEQG